MRAVVLEAPGKLTVTDLPDPTPLPDEAVVTLTSTGICGSDLHMLQGERAEIPLPVVMGHEMGGRVASLPDAYSGELAVGDLVAVEPYLLCGSCHACRAGRWPHCTRFTAYGVQRNGGLADAIAIRPDRLHRMDSDVTDLATLVEPLSIGAMAVSRADIRPGEKVLVMGAGPIGLAVLLSAKEYGGEVAIADTLPSRLALAEQLGADVCVDVTASDLDATVRSWTGGAGVDVALEATGVPAAAEQSVLLVCPAGRYVVVGLSPNAFRLPVRRLVTDGITVLGSRAGLFPEAVTLAEKNPGIAEVFVSHRFALEEAPAAFAQGLERPAETMKILLDVS